MVQTFPSLHILGMDVPIQMLNITKVIGRVHLHCKPESSAERPELMCRLVAESQQGERGDRMVFLACMQRLFQEKSKLCRC